jgi:ADP-heptose:LPS heptosyltransferase
MASQRFPILFITASRIGDAVLSSGLVRALTDEIEGVRFTIAASALTAPLFAEVPGLARTIVIEKRALGGHWFDLWNDARHQRWGLVVDMRGSGLARFLRARRRAAHKAGGPTAHKVIEAARLLKLEDAPPAPFLYTSPETEARAAELTAGAGPILAIAPAAHWVGKTWPAERFGLAARELLGPNGPLSGGRLMLVGGPEDRKVAETLRAALPKDRLIDLVGRQSLLVSYAALKRARLFIGGDSGLMHMAAAAGAPTLGLFGPSDERLYAPWGPKGRTVRGARGFEEIRALDPQLNQEICHMMELRVDAVTAAARRLIAETEPPREPLGAPRSAPKNEPQSEPEP